MRLVGTTSQSKHTDLGILHVGILSVTLFLVAINGIMGELGNGVDGSFLKMIWQYMFQQEIREWQPEHCRE